MDQDQIKDVNNADRGDQEPVRDLLQEEAEVPLFLRNCSDGQKGDAQDEKDKTGE